MQDTLKQELSLHPIKYNICLNLLLEKMEIVGEDVQTKKDDKHFSTPAKPVLNSIDIENTLKLHQNQIENMLDNYVQHGSGWTIQAINSVYINVFRYQPFQPIQPGGLFIKTPSNLAKKRCLINVKSSDDYCFLYAILAVLKQKEIHISRCNATNPITYQQFMQEINYQNISFPMKIESLPKFETLNLNISINVFGCDVRSKQNHIIPLYISNYLDMRPHEINLLLLHNGIRSHYIGIILIPYNIINIFI